MSRTILVVDDDPDLLAAHRFFLERAGYRVVTACDGDKGIHSGLTDQPDLVLLDLLMPRVSGFVVLEKLKQQLHSRTRFVMLTGTGAQAHRDFAEFLGADEYLEKPIMPEQLLATIARFCPLS